MFFAIYYLHDYASTDAICCKAYAVKHLYRVIVTLWTKFLNAYDPTQEKMTREALNNKLW